jgi:hypothetical protein
MKYISIIQTTFFFFAVIEQTPRKDRGESIFSQIVDFE